jgi:hypothetical protein
VVRHTVFREPGKTSPVESGLNHKVEVVEDQRTVDSDRERPVALIEFPLVDALPSMPEADASMSQQVSGRCRFGV